MVTVLGYLIFLGLLIAILTQWLDETVSVSRISLTEREQLLARQGIRPSARVHHIELGFTAPGVLERLDPQRYDQILVLASELLAETDQADATTVFTYQVLIDLLPETGPRPQPLIELQHAENLELFPTDHAVVLTRYAEQPGLQSGD